MKHLGLAELEELGQTQTLVLPSGQPSPRERLWPETRGTVEKKDSRQQRNSKPWSLARCFHQANMADSRQTEAQQAALLDCSGLNEA